MFVGVLVRRVGGVFVGVLVRCRGGVFVSGVMGRCGGVLACSLLRGGEDAHSTEVAPAVEAHPEPVAYESDSREEH